MKVRIQWHTIHLSDIHILQGASTDYSYHSLINSHNNPEKAIHHNNLNNGDMN